MPVVKELPTTTNRPVHAKGRKTPLIVILALWLNAFGFSFPIYGYSFSGSFRVTAWRIGLCILLPMAAITGARPPVRRGTRLLMLFGALAVIRIISVIAISDRASGRQQTTWYVEGVLFLISCTALAISHPDFIRRYLYAAFALGSASILAMVVQMGALAGGVAVALPFSETSFGFPLDIRPWTYPLGGGGRILGGFLDPNMSGSMCAFFIAMFVPFAMRRVPEFVGRTVLIGMLLLSGLALIGTGSRQAGVGAALSIVVTCVHAFVGGRLGRGAMLVCTLVAVGGCSILVADPTRFAILTPFGAQQQSIAVRIADDTISGGPTGGRLREMQDLVDSLDAHTVGVGLGEGLGNHSAHNAYLITLQELGVCGVLLLLGLSAALLIWPISIIRARPSSIVGCGAESALNVSLTWIFLCFANWAQLNQSVSFLFLAFVCMIVASNGAVMMPLRRKVATAPTAWALGTGVAKRLPSAPRARQGIYE